jgi:predicted HicB family RNase H-like nuclease
VTDHNHYEYRVFWSDEDQEYVGVCTEFPTMSWLEPEMEAALRGIRGRVKEELEDLARIGIDPPVPFSDRSFSGRFVVRTTPDTHRRLAARAAAKRVSMNQLVNSLLADA